MRKLGDLFDPIVPADATVFSEGQSMPGIQPNADHVQLKLPGVWNIDGVVGEWLAAHFGRLVVASRVTDGVVRLVSGVTGVLRPAGDCSSRRLDGRSGAAQPRV